MQLHLVKSVTVQAMSGNWGILLKKLPLSPLDLLSHYSAVRCRIPFLLDLFLPRGEFFVFVCFWSGTHKEVFDLSRHLLVSNMQT